MSANQPPRIAQSVDELLSYYNEEFVYCAYQTLLERAPDAEGLRYYLARVRAGVSKVEILAQLRLSKEGKSRPITIPGLDEAIKRHKLFKTPVLGALLKIAGAHHPETDILRNLRALENKVYALNNNLLGNLAQINNERLEIKIPTNPQFGRINHNPLVSIISVNYNGAKDLPFFLESVAEQSYRNFELVIVDNNSIDNSEEIIKKFSNRFKTVKFINSGANLGFAAGNNFALPYCRGELIALLNIDTKVDKEWLKELVDAMSLDGSCAAVTSKTLFFVKFQDLELKLDGMFYLKIDELVKSLQYKKYFIRQGTLKGDLIYSDRNNIIISLPIQNKPIDIKLIHQTEKITYLAYKIGKNESKFINFDQREINLNLNLSEEILNSSYIINNAGSIKQDGMPADRGFGEYDLGQYDSKCYVDYFCGVSVLLRRSAILDRKIFVSEFFAYYEDSELSRWIREQGYTILYAPRSVLYHQHSATSSEGSPFWNLLVTRSRNIYQYNGDIDNLYLKNNHLEEYFKPDVHEVVFNQLKSYSRQLRTRLKVKNEIVEKLKPIGIYNSYWNTKGGGESHALAFAKVLQQYETVYLISENNFDIDELARYYGIDLSNCRKIIEPNINEAFTKKFNIFINSTYGSNLNSLANNSYYIVSFPHQGINPSLLNTYTFLYNSEYTKKWAEKYWGSNVKSEIIYPLGMLNYQDLEIDKISKEKIILSVGRFFVGGHSKNQHIIAKAFKYMIEQDRGLQNWQLVLIGSLNQNSEADVAYVRQIEHELKGLNYKLIINADRVLLNSYFMKAYIYVHASGYGSNPEKEPDRFEHFGITPVEAMLHGCYPLVYNIGGPAELTKKLLIGDRFGSVEELTEDLIKVTHKYPSDIKSNVFKNIFEFINQNNHDAIIEKRLGKQSKGHLELPGGLKSEVQHLAIR
jgi:GT2 family glycosyltransferase